MSTLNVLWKTYLYPSSNSIKSSSLQTIVSGRDDWIILPTVSTSQLVASIPKRQYKKNEALNDAVCESEEFVDVCPGTSEGMTLWKNKSIIITDELLIIERHSVHLYRKNKRKNTFYKKIQNAI